MRLFLPFPLVALVVSQFLPSARGSSPPPVLRLDIENAMHDDAVAFDVDLKLGYSVVDSVLTQIEVGRPTWLSTGGLSRQLVAGSVCDLIYHSGFTAYQKCMDHVLQMNPEDSLLQVSYLAKCVTDMQSWIPSVTSNAPEGVDVALRCAQDPCLCRVASELHELVSNLSFSISLFASNAMSYHASASALLLPPSSDPVDSAMATSLSDFSFAAYENRPHYQSFLSNLTSHALSLEPEVEGGLYVSHGASGAVQNYHRPVQKRECLLTKLSLLGASASSSGLRIGEVGFNAGHSAFLYLDVLKGTAHGDQATYHGFDICRHRYTEPAALLLQREFGPGRVKLTCGDSASTLVEHAGVGSPPFDFFVVDGLHEELAAYGDIVAGCAVTRRGGPIVVDDCDQTGVRRAFLRTVQEGVIDLGHQGLCWADMCHGICK